jgi:hypothetical protein
MLRLPAPSGLRVRPDWYAHVWQPRVRGKLGWHTALLAARGREDADTCQVGVACAGGTSCVSVWLLLTGMSFGFCGCAGLQIRHPVWRTLEAKGGSIGTNLYLLQQQLICFRAWHITLLSEYCRLWLAG